MKNKGIPYYKDGEASGFGGYNPWHEWVYYMYDAEKDPDIIPDTQFEVDEIKNNSNAMKIITDYFEDIRVDERYAGNPQLCDKFKLVA